ncbi:phasin family protein [Aquaspirillum serpens]|uniref:phasin family protein n=1 Tax=Aquaspirillum serpens TaxID=190 RepID=UPI0003B41C89|nr:phasin family protein [Aquaspirillum serpens]
MFNTPEQFTKVSANGLQTLLRFSEISLNGLERLIKLQLETTKHTLEEQAKLAQEFSSVSDNQEAIKRVNQLAAASVEQLVAASRNFYDVVSQTQGELSKLAEDNLSEFNKNVVTVLDQIAQNAPAGSDTAVNALKSSIAATAAAMDSMTKAAKQVAEFADTSVKAASTATADAVKNASNKK